MTVTQKLKASITHALTGTWDLFMKKRNFCLVNCTCEGSARAAGDPVTSFTARKAASQMAGITPATPLLIKPQIQFERALKGRTGGQG